MRENNGGHGRMKTSPSGLASFCPSVCVILWVYTLHMVREMSGSLPKPIHSTRDRRLRRRRHLTRLAFPIKLKVAQKFLTGMEACHESSMDCAGTTGGVGLGLGA